MNAIHNNAAEEFAAPIGWQDITSYRNGAPRVPTSWELRTDTGMRIVVHASVLGSGWFVSIFHPELLSAQALGDIDSELARSRALWIAERYLVEHMRSFRKAAGMLRM